MRIPRLRALLTVLATGAVMLSATSHAGAAPGPRLVLDENFPDPDVLRVGSTYHAYSTASAGRNIQVATSSSPDGGWSIRGDALPQLGGWVDTAEPRVWAPDVSRRPDGTYLMYYTAHDTASDRQCIGTATATDPMGPFQPVGDGPLVCPAEQGGAIDAATFTDTDGTHYLLYKNDGNAIGVDTWIHLQKVSADGLRLEGAPARLLRQDRPEERGLVEAPTLVRHGDTYVLFYSAGSYGDQSYHVGYATSAGGIAGPYTKAAQPLLQTNEVVTGPGGQDVVSDGTRDYLVFHVVKTQDPLVRTLWVAELGWSGDRPVVR